MISKKIIYGVFFWILVFLQSFLLFNCDNKITIEPRFDKTFVKIFGREYSDEAIDLIQLDDGGFVMLGTSTEREEQADEQVPRDIFLVFTDSEGNQSEYFYLSENAGIDEVPTSMKKIGDDIYFSGYAVNENNDSDIIAGSFSISSRQYNWYNLYPGPENEVAMDLDMINLNQTDQLILAGRTDTTFNYLFVDFNGIVIDEGFPLSGLFDPSSNLLRIITVDNKPFIHVLVNWTRSFDDDRSTKEISIGYDDLGDGEIAGVSVESNIAEDDIAVDMITSQRIPNQLIVLGYIDQNNNPGNIVIIRTRFDENTGDIRQDNINPEFLNEINGILPKCIIETNDGGYAILGKNTQGVEEGGRIVLIKLDNGLNIEWQRSFGTGEQADFPGKLIQDTNSGFIFNSTVSFNENETNTKVGLFKTNMMGNLDFQ